MYICMVFIQTFSKIKCQVSNFFHQKGNIIIKIWKEYYPLYRRYGVPNIFPTRNLTSETKIFGLRLLVYLN